ncbi:MAG: adenine deaminase [bacterium]|nr:adenine deaminase [bacterium]
MDFANAASIKENIKAALGEIPCDLLLRGGKIVNVFTEEVFEESIAVHNGIIVGFGDRDAHNVADVSGCYIVPGFIDGHVHIESSMVTPAEYARAVLPRGTTAVMADPHEIGNVLGLAGIEFMRASDTPLDIYINLPSCVPATNLETSAAVLGADELLTMKDKTHVFGLGEMMNYPGVLFGDDGVVNKLAAFSDRFIDGHAPGLSGKGLHAYIGAGIKADHECTKAEEALEKLRAGMWIMIREGSLTRDLAALAPMVNDSTWRRCLFVSDDRECEDLVDAGHMDFIINKAIQLGIDPVRALIMASWNAASCFGLPRTGAIAPGFKADIAVIKPNGSLTQGFTVAEVYKDGRLMGKDGKPMWERAKLEEKDVPPYLNMAAFAKDDIRLCGKPGESARAIELVPDSILTNNIAVTVDNAADIAPDPERDLAKIAVFECHKGTSNCGAGLVRGFGIKRGALASTVAHDSHNMVIVGTNDEDILAAAEYMRHNGGGLAAVCDGKVLAHLPLELAGLMSLEPIEKVREKISGLYKAASELGCKLTRPFMAMAFMALPVVPSLKVTDRGLVDVDAFCLVDINGKPI